MKKYLMIFDVLYHNSSFDQTAVVDVEAQIETALDLQMLIEQHGEVLLIQARSSGRHNRICRFVQLLPL